MNVKNAEQNKPTTFYIFRHAETDANVRHTWNGHGDSNLTEFGKEQARLRAEELKDVHFDYAFSSDLSRTKDTARIIKLERNLEIEAREVLRERNMGKFEGRVTEELEKDFPELFAEFSSLSPEKRLTYNFKGLTETHFSSGQRLNLFLREAALAYPGKTILVVTHGGVMRGFLAELNPEHITSRFDNTGYIVLECDGIDFNVLRTEGTIKIEKK